MAAVSLLSLACASFGSGSSNIMPGLPRHTGPATIFAPGVVSTGDVFASTFSPDGRTVVFTKFSPPRMTLMTSTLRDGVWSIPVALPFSGRYRDLDPSFTPDGNRLYFSSWRPIDEATLDTMNASDTWYVDRRRDGWDAPIRLAEPANSGEIDMYPSVTRSGTLYFDSFRSTPRRRLVYRAERRGDGSLATPVALDATINADSGASNLFVDPWIRTSVTSSSRRTDRKALALSISTSACGSRMGRGRRREISVLM
ncbi:MAG: hypothetical protein ACJ796_18655 [Gemmatimonadaceae bacterium]